MKPFFCYYGGKYRAAKKYPTPKYSTIIESHAGAAGYATRYSDHKIILYEIDPTIAGLWSYLIKVTPSEIMSLPLDVENVDTLRITEEAKSLIGFWLNKGTTQPCKKPSAWCRSKIRPNSFWGETIRNRIASQVDAIRHWSVVNSSYEYAPNTKATWFVDPPYQNTCGQHYKYKKIDYSYLGKWCRERSGQVIACEYKGANWLPFKELATIKSNPSKRGKSYSSEVYWSNMI
jgi:site-specific DNA-adenine methylase